MCRIESQKAIKCVPFAVNVCICASITSPVTEAQDYNYQHQDKGTDQIWSLRDDMCRIEGQKAMKCVLFAVNVSICEMLFLTCTEHTSTMSPVNEALDYDYQHQDKGTEQIWSFRDDVRRTESQKPMKCVHLAVNVCICEMLFLTCTEHTSTTSPVTEAQDYDYQHQDKGTDQIWSFRDDVHRTESQTPMKCVPFAVNICICEMLFLTCTEHTSTMLPVNEALDYDY